jgi:hypothetical protein
MKRENAASSMSAAEIVSLFRGLYSRVARQLRVHPSYVSRVAHGQRESKEVQALLNKEISQILRRAQAFHFVGGRRLSKKPLDSGAAHGTLIMKVPSDGDYRD